VLAAEKGRVGERYILGNHNVMMRDFYEIVSRVADVPVPKRRIPRQVALGMGWAMEKVAERRKQSPLTTYKATLYTVDSHFYDNSKARRELGLPATPLDVTIDKSVRWFRANGYV
jgi:dihydroflavonol-4-reductase